MATCPNCGNQTGEGAIFCDQCGTRIPAPEAAVPEPAPTPAGGSAICPACGAGNVPGEAFCDYCGSPLDAPVPSAEMEPELEPASAEGELQAAGETVPPAAEGAAATDAEPVPDKAAALTCPACGAEVQPDEAFCADCGASLAEAPLPPEPVVEVEPEPEVEVVQPEPEADVVAAEPEAVAAPIVAEIPPEPVVEAAPSPLKCPACGTEVEADDAFCSSCGAVLEEAPPPAPVVEEAPLLPPSPPESAGPRLIVSASGAEIPLPASGEMLIGREDPVSGIYPDIDMTPHGGEDGGVSRRHARLIADGGNYFIEDLDSTNFTFVNKQKLAPKTRQQLNDGDEVRCGRVALVFQT